MKGNEEVAEIVRDMLRLPFPSLISLESNFNLLQIYSFEVLRMFLLCVSARRPLQVPDAAAPAPGEILRIL
jgi:hypothetical protein